MILSMLFVVFSLPIVTLGPCITALYRVLIQRSAGYEGLMITAFWKSLKENFRNAIVIEAIFAPLVLGCFVLVLLIYIEVINTLPLIVLCLLYLVLLLFSFSYAFPLAAQFDNTPWKTFINSIILSIIHFPISVAVVIVNLLPIILYYFNAELFFFSLPFLMFFGIAIMAWINEKLLHQVFRKFISESDRNNTNSFRENREKKG